MDSSCPIAENSSYMHKQRHVRVPTTDELRTSTCLSGKTKHANAQCMWTHETIIRHYLNSCTGHAKTSSVHDFIGVTHKSFVFKKHDDVYMYLNSRQVLFRFRTFKINFFPNDKGNWKISQGRNRETCKRRNRNYYISVRALSAVSKTVS